MNAPNISCLHAVTPAEAEEGDLKTHVAVCRQRYEGIAGRLDALEGWMKWLVGIVAGGFVSILGVLIANMLVR